MKELPEDKQLRFVNQEDRPQMSPQLALRVAIVGTLALAIFAILFFRLWFLQVLSSDHYARAASVNFVRPVEIAAPRGQILDRTGTILATSQRAYAVEISPPDLPVPLTEKLLAGVEALTIFADNDESGLQSDGDGRRRRRAGRRRI